MIELNFCNLNKNIKKRIYERGNSEIRDSNHLIDESLEEIEISLKIWNKKSIIKVNKTLIKLIKNS